MTLTAEQHAARKIGSSDAAVAAGVDPWREAFGWWQERTGRADPPEESVAMRVGTYMEPLLREMAAEALGVEVFGPVEITDCAWAPWATANLDAHVIEDGRMVPVELKTASAYVADKWGESGSDEIPINYVMQVTHQMAVVDASHAYVAALIGNGDFRWFRLERSADLVERLHAAEARLCSTWSRTSPRRPRPWEGCTRRWPDHADGKVYELTEPEWQRLIEMQPPAKPSAPPRPRRRRTSWRSARRPPTPSLSSTTASRWPPIALTSADAGCSGCAEPFDPAERSAERTANDGARDHHHGRASAGPHAPEVEQASQHRRGYAAGRHPGQK
jgi:putative phage-type endonuclease